MVEGNDWQGGKGEPAYDAAGFQEVLIGDFDVCDSYFYCYHVPIMMEKGNEAYIGLS